MDVFFADDSDLVSIGLAKSVCSVCPVKTECLAFALDVGDTVSVLGGMTGTERIVRFGLAEAG